MSVYQHPDFDQHQLVAFKQDRASGLQAIITVHDNSLGPATGGCRMYPYANEAAALADVLRLSRGMTYKSALAGLPLGGGKAVIIGDPARDKTRRLLLAMGDFVDSLNGKYVTAQDSGTDAGDMAIIAERTSHVSALAGNRGADPSISTAHGVYEGIRAAVKFRFGTDLQGVRVALQGLGNVGYRLARLLHAAGAEVYGADVRQDNVARAVVELGVVARPWREILSAGVEVLAPCALGGSICAESLDRISASVIAGAANNQLATPDMDAALCERGILYAPDYVINAGGIIDVHFRGRGMSGAVLRPRYVAQIGARLSEIFSQSAATGKPTGEIADRMAEAIFRAPQETDRAA